MFLVTMFIGKYAPPPEAEGIVGYMPVFRDRKSAEVYSQENLQGGLQAKIYDIGEPPNDSEVSKT